MCRRVCDCVRVYVSMGEGVGERLSLCGSVEETEVGWERREGGVCRGLATRTM